MNRPARLFFLLAALLGFDFSFADLRNEVALLAENGNLDSALTWVQSRIAAGDKSEQASLLEGKLQLRGDKVAKLLTPLKNQRKKSAEQAEALYLLGQYQYAAGRYHMAIPIFRDYFQLYPEGEDGDRAAYWMANASLHLALTQADRFAYIDSGLVYIERMRLRQKADAYYATLASECAARLLLARGDGLRADSLLAAALTHAPNDEKPALMLLQAQTRRAIGKNVSGGLDTLEKKFPQSPEAIYVRKLKGKLPRPPVAIASATDSLATVKTATTVTATKSSDTALQVTPSPTSTFLLQVGSFAQAENAQALVNQLMRKGIAAKIKRSKRGNQNLYQVLVGPFNSTEAAEKFGIAQLKPLQLLFQIKNQD